MKNKLPLENPKATLLPSWDLSSLYKSITDPKIAKDLKLTLWQAKSFNKKYKGSLESITAKKLAGALCKYETILQEAVKPVTFATLIFAENSNNSKNSAFYQEMKARHLEIYQQVLFFELELLQLPENKLVSLTKDEALQNYHHFLKLLLINKSHRLSEKEERIFNDKSLTGSGAFVRLFDEELARKKFDFTLRGKKKLLNESVLLDLFHNPDRETRKAAALALSKGLQEELKRLTFITNILAEDKAVNDRYFKYQYPEESRHLANEIDRETVETLTRVVTKNYKIVQEYYTFKKSVLGYKTLEVYDVYAPSGKTTKKISYQEAKNITLSSFTKFTPEYSGAAKLFFDNNWIDVGIKEGKRGGAFCEYVTPDLHPFILMNYSGNIRDVLTLAHELGHGVNAYYSRKQTYLNFDWPLILAETASVFAEMLVFDHLKEELSPREKFSLYMSKVEDIFATIFRQISMYQFEQDIHYARGKKGELTAEEIGKLWNKRRREMFGNSVEVSDDYNSWWSYIPHFKHTPFYVYAYAFGELLTLSLYNEYKKDKEEFVPKYLELLSAGGTKTPEELLKPLGVNLKDEKFWQGGVDLINNLVRETRKMYAKNIKGKD
ncbi:MAG: oligoendopeptidase F [Microgenomates group bacterium Gr01-1014_5]|nr:MAG: oligoendopeptidase F [Microgenomates group bacterium Gr01-1014_5]